MGSTKEEYQTSVTEQYAAKLDRERVSAVQVGVLAIVTMAQASGAMASLGLAPLASMLQADFGVSRTELGVLLAASSTGSMAISLPSGWLTDSLGVRRTLALGLLSTGVLLAGVGFTNSLGLAVALMFMAGLGIGFISPTTTKAVVYWFPLRLRGTAMGIKQTGYPFGGALSAMILPTLALLLGGWRAAVVTVGLLAFAVGLLCLRTYREHPAQNAAKGSKGGIRLGHFVALIRDRRLLGVAAFGLFSGLIQTALMGYLSLFLQEVLFIPVVAAGAYLALTQVAGAAGRVGWGVVSDRIFGGRRRPVMLIVSALQIVMALAMSAVSPSYPSWLLIGTVCLFGLVAIGWSGVFHTCVAEIGGRERAGTAIGIGLLLSYGGVVLGPPVFGFLVDTLGSYSYAWALLALFALGGLLPVLKITEPPRQEM